MICPRPHSAAADSWDYHNAPSPCPQPACWAAHTSPASGKPRFLPGQSRALPLVRPLSKERVSWKKAHVPNRRASSGSCVLNSPLCTLKASNGIHWILKHTGTSHYKLQGFLLIETPIKILVEQDRLHSLLLLLPRGLSFLVPFKTDWTRGCCPTLSHPIIWAKSDMAFRWTRVVPIYTSQLNHLER